MATGYRMTNYSRPIFGDSGMDWLIEDGKIVTLSGRERVRQNVLKMVLTSRRDEYGTNISAFVGQKRFAPQLALNYMSIQQGVRDYMDAQPAGLPDEEVITSIRSLSVEPHDAAPDRVRILLELNMGDGDRIEIQAVA